MPTTLLEDKKAAPGGNHHQFDFRRVHALIDAQPDPSTTPRGSPPIILEKRGTTSHATITPSPAPKKDWQAVLLLDLVALKSTLAVKLAQAGGFDEANKLENCRTTKTYQKCDSCRKVTSFWNRCENAWCPCCQARLAKDKRRTVEWWAKLIRQPKHMVLTVRNAEQFSPEYVAWFKACWRKLRNQAWTQSWRGGLWSMEVTNEGKGWHLHLHALVDANYIPAEKLATAWAKLVGQDYAICRVYDARDKDYCHEVMKYLVKPSAMAKWQPAEILQFVRTICNVKMFGTFGDLYKHRAEWKKFVEDLTHQNSLCPCGCNTFRYYTESEWLWQQLQCGQSGAPPPPERPHAGVIQPELLP